MREATLLLVHGRSLHEAIEKGLRVLAYDDVVAGSQ